MDGMQYRQLDGSSFVVMEEEEFIIMMRVRGVESLSWEVIAQIMRFTAQFQFVGVLIRS
jgi:hypothetical protein